MVDNDKTPELTAEEIAELQEFKQKYADSTKESQLLAWENKVLKDPQEFIKLYDSDKRQATEVAKRSDFDDADAMLTFIKEETAKGDKSDNLEELAAKLDAMNEGKKVAALVEKFMEERKLDPESEVGKAFMEEYQDLAGKKKLNTDKATKYLKIAFNEVKGNYQFAEEHSRKMREAKAAGVSGGSQKTDDAPKKTTYVRNKKVSLANLPQYNK